MPAGSTPKIGLIMSGGGARAAYQVGVLRAVAELMPRRIRNPFPVICGTSAGAVNAAVLAANGSSFRRGVRELMRVWKQFHADHVYRSDPAGVIRTAGRWILAALAGGGLGRQTAISLLDTSPLRALIAARLDFPAIQAAIDAGDLTAVAVTCSGYTSGQAVTFYQGAPDLVPWKRARRVGMPMALTVDHLLASSALPFLFPAVRISREYFGDGSMRQLAPISPALHLGADRLFVVGVGRQLGAAPARTRGDAYPSLAQIAGHCLNSIFLDSLESDLERLKRINRTLELIPGGQARNGTLLRHVDYRMLAPSEELEPLALRYAGELPAAIRVLLYGARRRSGSTLLSYLLFEPAYCGALIELGYRDAMRDRESLIDFFGWNEPGGANTPRIRSTAGLPD